MTAGPTPRYGIVDTTFSTVNMGDIAERTLREMHAIAADRIERRTVPGFKDLGAAARQMLDGGCDIVIACGMPGPEPIDKQCAQDAAIGLQICQQLTGKHILEVFVHMDEIPMQAPDYAERFRDVVDNRVSEHATNAYWLLEEPEELRARAGTGQRQGFQDVGPLEAQG